MRIAVITPHQDPARSKFLNQLKNYVANQTRQPDEWFIVDDQTGLEKDLTKRIKIGLDRALEACCQIAIVMEDDDWYHPSYIDILYKGWLEAGKPDLYGQGYTDYYHIKIKSHARLMHPGRASLMSTLIYLPSAYKMKFPADDHVFLDISLWKQLKGKTFTPAKPVAVGIKHGVGITGGTGHRENWALYKSADPKMDQLRSLIGYKDCLFYEQYFL